MSGSEFDYSDLTDVDNEPNASSRREKKSGQKSAYRIRNALKVPRATTYTAQALYDQIHSADINLEPEYQRDVVWPEAKQIGIIDSIFRNFYIPPVIFAVNASDDGSETKTCIDGKQRLTSIHRFMDGLIPHKDPHTSEKLWYKDVGSGAKARKLLPEKYRRLFANKQIVCVEYQDITDGDEREIFQRVQLGMALTPAEKLQVIHGPRAAFIRELQSTYLKDGLEDGLNWDSTRGGDFRCLAQAVFVIEKYPTQKHAGTISQLEKWLSLDDPPSSELTETVHNTYRVFLHLIRDNKYNKVFAKHAKVAPIEFIMISLLITQYKDTFSPAQLTSAIELMREDVRKEHVDIRMNNYVGKTMMDFIKGMKASKFGGVASSESAATSVGQKRKRETENNLPKAKKSSTNAPNFKPPSSQTPRPAPSTSAEKYSHPQPTPASSSVVTAFNKSFGLPSDRLAPVRAAKQAALALQPPSSGSAALHGNYPPSLSSTSTPRNSLFSNEAPRLTNNPLEDSLTNYRMFPSNREMSGTDYPSHDKREYGQQDRGWDRGERSEREHERERDWDGANGSLRPGSRPDTG